MMIRMMIKMTWMNVRRMKVEKEKMERMKAKRSMVRKERAVNENYDTNSGDESD